MLTRQHYKELVKAIGIAFHDADLLEKRSIVFAVQNLFLPWLRTMSNFNERKFKRALCDYTDWEIF